MADDTLVLGVSRTFIHYSANNFFMKKGQLIDDIKQIGSSWIP